MILAQFQTVGHDLFTRGLISSHTGNMSIRLGERLTITRRGSMLNCLQEQDLIETGIIRNSRSTPLASTELANLLVRNHHIPFRTAHKIVGKLVSTLIHHKKFLTDTTPELLRDVATPFLDFRLDVSAEELRTATTLLDVISSHQVTGGPSIKEVQRMAEERKKWLTASSRAVLEKSLSLKRSTEELDKVIKRYATNLSFDKV